MGFRGGDSGLPKATCRAAPRVKAVVVDMLGCAALVRLSGLVATGYTVAGAVSLTTLETPGPGE